jgi:hypothetical protein
VNLTSKALWLRKGFAMLVWAYCAHSLCAEMSIPKEIFLTFASGGCKFRAKFLFVGEVGRS